MISGSLAGPNTIRARTTISTSSSGPIPRKFIAAGLCPPYLASVDLKLLGAGQDFVGESGAVGAGDPHLAFRVRFGAGDTMHDVLVDLARGDARLVLAKARLQLLERGRRLGWRAGG